MIRNERGFIGRRAVRALLLLAVLAGAGVLSGYGWYASAPLIEVFNLPDAFSRRHGSFTVNVCGSASPLPGFLARRLTRGVRYRLNEGPWMEAGRGGPRVPPPLFAVELGDEALLPGLNTLTIEAASRGRRPDVRTLQFRYDPAPIRLPVRLDWASDALEVEDGRWEVFTSGGERRVRPRPGFEGYDRILVLAGAFSGGRRVVTDAIFREKVDYSNAYGFGVLSMWGGRPDDAGVGLRRGWSFGLTWYWNRYEGVGSEFSYKYGDDPPKWVNSYRNLDLRAGVRYSIEMECWPERDAAGRHVCHRQRVRWWPEGEAAPDAWVEVTDTEGAPLPPGEYGVALIAYHAQVDFGPVLIEALDSPGREVEARPVSSAGPFELAKEGYGIRTALAGGR